MRQHEAEVLNSPNGNSVKDVNVVHTLAYAIGLPPLLAGLSSLASIEVRWPQMAYNKRSTLILREKRIKKRKKRNYSKSGLEKGFTAKH